MDAIGICVGASSVSYVKLTGSPESFVVKKSLVHPHGGDCRAGLARILNELGGLEARYVAVTGRKFRNLLRLESLSEPEAVELAAAHVFRANPCQTIVSAGAETFMVYRLGPDGRIEEIKSGNKCASGTGEFLEQQLGRIGLTVDDLAGFSLDHQPHKVSGRCSVFCKSDCTHALNKGVPRPNVVAGLAQMMSGKCLELLKKLPRERVALLGGCSQNRFMAHYLAQEVGELVIPEQAPWFEALGAAIYALNNRCRPKFESGEIFAPASSSFTRHQPLAKGLELVEFKSAANAKATPGDEVILGLDVGSTTTKGVLLRRSDKAVLAKDYLRTEGDPVGASRRVYASLAAQLDGVKVEISGLGVTGSGRAIAGMHAKTQGVINEIIAHATAAVYFDPEVDTIFEIGGQDAKYTYLENSVPCDYAMNEACSAGTGSFLEEAAKESLGLAMTEIADLALKGQSPPNFNDQCAAFISSDIALAAQEGVAREDIVAGLVYSICLNYANRVKGNRQVGRKVFMQGGVCYNRAVPAAMALLTGKRIVVPPEPGLMGAFGVALEVEARLAAREIEPASFDLAQLAVRDVKRREPFVCKGGKHKCDQGCEVARIEIEGKVFPFGGICSRYDGTAREKRFEANEFDLVAERERLVFSGLKPELEQGKPGMGISRSLLSNTYYPLYSTFFKELGFNILLPKRADPAGCDMRAAALCYPGELSHGYLASLLKLSPDHIFLPQVRAVPGPHGHGPSCTCVLVQGEPYYLRGAFAELGTLDSPGNRILTPVLEFTRGLAQARGEFIKIGHRLGFSQERSKQAFEQARLAQRGFASQLKKLSERGLARLGQKGKDFGVVIFGRPYNAFSSQANKGIPAKFATRGHLALPHDSLHFEAYDLEPELNMYWGIGRTILQAARLVAGNDRLFGVYVSNFSCGPDSFLLTHFREIMGKKPSLTLELDSHTADAGIDTRIEAFLDIASHHLKAKPQQVPAGYPGISPARFEMRGQTPGILASDGTYLPLTHERVRLVFPSMNRFVTPLTAKAVERGGIRGAALPPADEEALKLGRGASTCKECLPLQLTAGALLKYLDKRPKDEVTVYFMPSAGGPCRFGQYEVFARKLIEKRAVPDAVVFSPSTLNGYLGLGNEVTLAIWRAVIIGDIFEEMWSTLLAGAKHKEPALTALTREFEAVRQAAGKPWPELEKQLKASARELAKIELSKAYHELPKLSLVGEIYVRQDPISRQRIIERLADKGFVVRTSHTAEWVKYTDWLVKTGTEGAASMIFWVRHLTKRMFDKKVRKALAGSGLFHAHAPRIRELIAAGKRHISPKLTGEAILTVGAAYHEMLSPACGVISIGPFGCMPSRLAESVLSEKFTSDELELVRPGTLAKLGPGRKLPFLAIETDGNPFPQVIEARIEAFCLQAARMHEKMKDL